MPNKEVTCNNCGWVHFEVTRAFAEQQVAAFNAHYETLSDEAKSHYSTKQATIEPYERCNSCRGSYKNFRPAVDGDCPKFCTINPIIASTE